MLELANFDQTTWKRLARINRNVNREVGQVDKTDGVAWPELVVGPEGDGPASGGNKDQGDKHQQEESFSGRGIGLLSRHTR